MFLFYNKQDYQNSLPEVFSLFSKPLSMGLLTHTNLNIILLSDPEHKISKGSVLDYKICFLGKIWRWTSYIDSYEKNKYFSELQLKGPFRYWRHSYRFSQNNQNTEIENELVYDFSFLGAAKLINNHFMKPKLYDLFARKNKKKAKQLNVVGYSQCLN